MYVFSNSKRLIEINFNSYHCHFYNIVKKETRNMAGKNETTEKHSPLHLRTPLIESYPLSEIAGCRVHLKMENLQPSSSFKIRGLGHLIQKVRTRLKACYQP